MNVLDKIQSLARQSFQQQPTRIALAEGEDPRILHAAVRALNDAVAVPVLIGNRQNIEAALQTVPGYNDELMQKGLSIHDPADSSLQEEFVETYYDIRQKKGIDIQSARETMADPLFFSAMLVKKGHADGSLGGAVRTTGETLRAVLQIIGAAPGVNTVSSFFLMLLDQPHHPRQEALVFADCALIVDPTSEQLADIAVMAARSYEVLCESVPKVGLLSFSTAGSAKHKRVTRVQEAAQLIRQQVPELAITEDIQFDAALVPEIGARKAPDSPVAGQVNVFVFPSLEAANIGYKIAERIGRAQAIGPIMQGLASPANDLSRGCSTEDVYQMLAATAVQASAQRSQ